MSRVSLLFCTLFNSAFSLLDRLIESELSALVLNALQVDARETSLLVTEPLFNFAPIQGQCCALWNPSVCFLVYCTFVQVFADANFMSLMTLICCPSSSRGFPYFKSSGFFVGYFCATTNHHSGIGHAESLQELAFEEFGFESMFRAAGPDLSAYLACKSAGADQGNGGGCVILDSGKNEAVF